MMRLKGNDGAASDDGGSSISCSICLEVVDDNGDRSWAKLQCSHRFHLDCIGSAFNAKGSMQCPNCRKVEKGKWLFANGSRSAPEISIEELVQDEDLYNISYSDLFGFHWCPYGEVAGVPSSIEEGELLSSAYQNLIQQQSFFAYFPIYPSSSNSIGGIPDASNLGNHWNSFPTVDRHHQNWEHHSSAFSNVHAQNGDQSLPIAMSTQRSNRTSPDFPGSSASVHPVLMSHSSGSRSRSSVPSTLMPHYSGNNAQTRDRVQALQAYYQQQRPNHSMSTRAQMVRRSGPHHRGMVPVPSSSDQTNRPYFFPMGPGRGFREQESMVPNRMQRDHLLSHADQDSGWSSGVRHGSFGP